MSDAMHRQDMGTTLDLHLHLHLRPILIQNSLPICRQNRVDITTEVCRYSDRIFTHIVGITGFLDCRNSGTPAIPTCRKNDTLLSELRYTLVGISVRRNKGTSE